MLWKKLTPTGVSPRRGGEAKLEMTTVFWQGRCSRTIPRFAVYIRSCKSAPRGVGSTYTRAPAAAMYQYISRNWTADRLKFGCSLSDEMSSIQGLLAT